MWQEINAYVQKAVSDNSDTIEKLNAAQASASGDGEAALANVFIRDLIREANDLDIRIRRFALLINPAVKAEAAADIEPMEKEGG